MEPKVVRSIDWEYALKKPGTVCCVSGESFTIGDEYVSFLRYDGEAGWQRADISPSCFEELEKKPFAYWRAKVAEPDKQKARPLDLNFLTEFFVRLQEQKDSTEHQEVGYIVTLLLVRKKVLVQLGLKADDDLNETLEVRFRKDKEGDVFQVPVPEINAEKMDMIRDDLGRIFNLDEIGKAAPAEEKSDDFDSMIS